MLQTDYNRSADYWAFGVFVFELLAGSAPFGGATERERHNKICAALVPFQEGFNLQGRDLVSKLCVVNVSQRLGMGAAGTDAIQDHLFFAELSWAALQRGDMRPPFVPNMRSRAQWEARPPMHFADDQNQIRPEDQHLFDGYTR